MATIAEAESMALELSESDRAALAYRLLQSLPPVFEDDDDGYAEAARRCAELDANPDIAITAEQFDELIRNRRR